MDRREDRAESDRDEQQMSDLIHGEPLGRRFVSGDERLQPETDTAVTQVTLLGLDTDIHSINTVTQRKMQKIIIKQGSLNPHTALVLIGPFRLQTVTNSRRAPSASFLCS